MSITAPLGDILIRLNIIWVMLWQSFAPKRQRDSMKLVWVFLEPAGQLIILATLFSLIGRDGGYGRNFALFLFSGIVTLLLFRRGSQFAAVAIELLNMPNRTVPRAGIFHGAIVGVLFETMVAVIYTPFICAFIWWWFRVEVTPHHPEILALGVVTVMALTFGVGLVRGYCLRFLPFVERIFKTLSRGLILISGVFFVPSWMPPEYREVLSYNPLIHAIELIRMGIYHDYPTVIFSSSYLTGWAVGSVTFGVALVWVARKRLRE